MERADPPGISPEPPLRTGPDPNATTEQEEISKQTLDQKTQVAEHTRKERMRQCFGWGTIAVLCTAFMLIIVAIIVVGLHYLTPSSWHWLEDSSLDAITTTLFSGSLFVFFGLYVRDKLLVN